MYENGFMRRRFQLPLVLLTVLLALVWPSFQAWGTQPAAGGNIGGGVGSASVTEAVYLDTAVLMHGILSTDFADGDGTEDDPYQIATAEQLNNVRKYPDAHFMLIADIDLDKPPYNQGEGWDPSARQVILSTANLMATTIGFKTSSLIGQIKMV